MESNRRGEVLSPAITLVDQQLRKLRDSMDKHGSKGSIIILKDIPSCYVMFYIFRAYKQRYNLQEFLYCVYILS